MENTIVTAHTSAVDIAVKANRIVVDVGIRLNMRIHMVSKAVLVKADP